MLIIENIGIKNEKLSFVEIKIVIQFINVLKHCFWINNINNKNTKKSLDLISTGKRWINNLTFYKIIIKHMNENW